MQTNNTFSFRRFWLLCQQSLILNRKIIGMAIIGFVGAVFVILWLFQSMNNDFRNWPIDSYFRTFFILFIGLGIIYMSLSFPAFRSREKSTTFLLLPSSTSEKYVFELLSRLLIFIILMPLLFWLVVKIEGAVVHRFDSSFVSYQFTLEEVINKLKPSDKVSDWMFYTYVQMILFAFIFSFAGASHFSKSPLLKTLFTFSLLAGGYFLLIYLLYKGLNLRDYNPVNNRILGMEVRNHSPIIGGIALTVINLTILAFSFFRLKEREV
jgi:hypothetical protein